MTPRGTAIAGRLLALSFCLFSAITMAAEQRPNIVLIVLDDVGYSDLGSFGGEIETPHLDELARAGVRFSSFHTASSCAPTRAMLMTGMDHHLAGIGNLSEAMPLAHRGEPGYLGVLDERVVTVASLLQSAGYRTVVAGKWHLGHGTGNLPPARGFEDSIIQADSGADNFTMKPYLPMTPEVRWYDNGRRMDALPGDFYSSTHFVDRTVSYLTAGEDSDRPFFAYLAFQANHTPLQAPDRFLEQYRGRYSGGWHAAWQDRLDRLQEYGLIPPQAGMAPPPSAPEWQALSPEQRHYEARRMQAYAAMATAMDHEVGRLIAYLRASGQYDNTVFVVLSDNGASVAEPYENAFARWWLERNFHHDVEHLGEKGSWVAAGRGWGRVSNAPLSGYKFTASEGGTRVPLFIAGALPVTPGLVRGEFAYVTDIAPTLLDIAGVPLSDGESYPPMSGRSLRALLEESHAGDWADARATAYEFAGHSAVYQDGYKLVRNRPPVGDGQWRLFRIAVDPGETRDLATELPERFQAMQSTYAAYVVEAGVLEVPDDYVLQRQAMVNALLFDYLPRALPWFVGLLLAIVAGVVLRRRRRVVRA